MTQHLPLTDGRFALVDDEDFERVARFTWHTMNPPYDYVAGWVTNDQGYRQKVLLHRFLMNAQQGEEYDHLDGNRLNNCRDNLQIKDRFRNQQNRTRANRTSSTGVLHVHSSWDRHGPKFYARVRRYNRQFTGPFHRSIEEAQQDIPILEAQLQQAYEQEGIAPPYQRKSSARRTLSARKRDYQIIDGRSVLRPQEIA